MCNHDNYISERDKKFPLVSFPPPLVANQIFLSTLPVNATMYNAKLEIVHGQVLKHGGKYETLYLNDIDRILLKYLRF